jgi:N-ethylmaleimide reductase
VTRTNLLFEPLSLGRLTLPNRVLMAPMTRCRAGEGNVPTALMATYYAQRASAGLIISEATQVAPEGVGFLDTPGIHTEAQVEGWRRVTDAVHAASGRIVLQLWHVGRMSHPLFQPEGRDPVAPSAIAATGEIFTREGTKPLPVPRALETDEVSVIVRQFADGAARAKRAGFDGVEIHAANGYIIDQFLRDGSNVRTDRYGGSLENRLRFLVEVTSAVCEAWGDAAGVGVRVNPSNVGAMQDSAPDVTFPTAAAALSAFGLAYLHVLEFPAGHPWASTDEQPRRLPALRRVIGGAVIASGGYDGASAEAVLARGHADAVAFGQLFIANPDLPARLRRHVRPASPDPETFYSGDQRGYTDYPALSEDLAG